MPLNVGEFLTAIFFSSNLAWNLPLLCSQDSDTHVLGDPDIEPSPLPCP